MTSLFRSTQLKLPFQNGLFHFAMTRQLETLLTTCSIPVANDRGIAGVALVDADLLGCLFEGRGAQYVIGSRSSIREKYLLTDRSFQFRFLIQCHKHFSQLPEYKKSRRKAVARIKSACTNHLTWLFKIAKFSGTWEIVYRVGDDPFYISASPNVPPTSRVVQGAMHFSKLWLYLRTWPDESKPVAFVLTEYPA